MNIKENYSEILGEKYFEIEHESGLKILVMPKENYSSAYALFGTRYGSIDTKFKLSNEEEFTEVPEGIAHFLEHKLFESEELDAFARYAKTGASANAYTSFDRTCYLFQCSANFKENLKILIDFVQNPYFTAETVKKEQGIIGQEIQMYLDSPGWMSMFNLLRCLYVNHPVRIDIAGTRESIAQITDTLLYECYNTFYNLSNMALAVAGNVSVDEVLEVCDEYLKPCKPITIERAFKDEPRDINKDREEYILDVGMPVFAFGYKEECKNAIQSVKDTVECELMLEIIAGKMSPLYKELLDKGLINPSFSAEYCTGNGFEAIMFEGESEKPDEVAKAIKAEVKRLRKEGIDSELFEAVRRSMYGKEIMSYNDIDNIANSLIACEFNSWKLFDAVRHYKNVTKADIEKKLNEKLDERYCALSIVKKGE